MCCFFTSLVLVGPRLGILVWGLIQPARWDATFSTFLWPLMGFLVLPWTTLMYVAVFPLGISGFDWFWLALGLFADIASYTGGAYGNKDKIKSYGPTPPPPATA